MYVTWPPRLVLMPTHPKRLHIGISICVHQGRYEDGYERQGQASCIPVRHSLKWMLTERIHMLIRYYDAAEIPGGPTAVVLAVNGVI